MKKYPKTLKFTNPETPLYVLIRKHFSKLSVNKKIQTTRFEGCYQEINSSHRYGLSVNPFLFAKFGKSWGYDLTDHKPTSNKLVTQKPFECVIASMAMYLNFDYEELRKIFREMFPDKNKAEYFDQPLPGYGYSEYSLVFDKLGYSIMNMNANAFPDEPCLVTVPSINIQGKRHQVFFDGNEILDPQVGNDNMNFYSSQWGPQESGALGYIVARKR